MLLSRRISQHFPYNPNFIFSFHRGFSSKLFVRGIPFSTTEASLSEAFSEFGRVVEVKIVMNKKLKRPKGFGYVTFSTEEDAQKALAGMNGKILGGRVLYVDEQKENLGDYVDEQNK